MSTIDRLLANLFLVFLSIFLCLASLEIFARYRVSNPKGGIFREINDNTYYPRPFVMSSAKPGILDHNELGYRGKLPDFPKPAGEYRIFIFGGSVIYNDTGKGEAGIEFKDTLPNKIQKLFAKNKMDQVKVYSFGAVSSNSRQDLMRLILDASGYQPDLCIFYFGNNDLSGAMEFRPNYPHRHILFEINPAFQLKASDSPFLSYLALSSEFLRTYFPQVVEKIVITGELDSLKKRYFSHVSFDENEARKEDALVQNLLLAKMFSQSIGAKFIPILQPVLSTKNTLSENEKKLAPALNRKDLFEGFLKKAADADLSVVDFTRTFDNDNRSIYIDSVHVNDVGNSIVAERIFDLIKNTALKPTEKQFSNPLRKNLLPESHFHPPLNFYTK